MSAIPLCQKAVVQSGDVLLVSMHLWLAISERKHVCSHAGEFLEACEWDEHFLLFLSQEIAAGLLPWWIQAKAWIFFFYSLHPHTKLDPLSQPRLPFALGRKVPLGLAPEYLGQTAAAYYHSPILFTQYAYGSRGPSEYHGVRRCCCL